ncbi:MAG TPA: helix-turn-helix transcriptional regulator [Bacillales bacterium]|nr:helix-turn-helix transcriptional regulator [Bacillales bacterium]
MEHNFGRDVKLLRTKRKIGSRELSRLIGKAETYISQLERGQIKTPDYNTAFQIMKNLGQKEDSIEDILYNFYFIKSPLRIEAEAEWDRQAELNAQDPEYQQHLLEMQIEAYEQNRYLDDEEEINRSIDWLADLESELSTKNKEIHDEFTFYIDKKLDVFENVIKNLHTIVLSMRKNKENYDFFTTLFKRDLTELNQESKDAIIKVLKEEYKKSHSYNGGWGEPPSF